jgi:hypothetical protein
VQLGDDAKYEMKGDGTITFHLESRGQLDAQYVLYVPSLKKNLLLVSTREGKYSYVHRNLSQTNNGRWG